MPPSDKDTLDAIRRLYELYLDFALRPIDSGSGGTLARIFLADRLRDELIAMGFSPDQLGAMEADVRRAVSTVAGVRRKEAEHLATEMKLREQSELPERRHRNELNSMIAEGERAAGVHLTGAGRQMIRIPVIEIYQLTGDWNRPQIGESIGRIIETARDVQEGTAYKGRPRGAVDVIRGFAKNFCNIPPFCAGRSVNEDR